MDDFQLQTHNHHCEQLQRPLHDLVTMTYGLQNDSILNSSNVIDGLVPDVMHDILEGSLQYEVKELLKYCIHTY